MRRRARSIALGLAFALLAASPAVGAPGGANHGGADHGGADPRELRQQADRVQARVDALTRRLDGQLAARDRAVQELGGAVQRAMPPRRPLTTRPGAAVTRAAGGPALHVPSTAAGAG